MIPEYPSCLYVSRHIRTTLSIPSRAPASLMSLPYQLSLITSIAPFLSLLTLHLSPLPSLPYLSKSSLLTLPLRRLVHGILDKYGMHH
jgi:hypothetical protein